MSLLKTGMKGLAWTTVSVVVRDVVALLQITILTRFLEKSDFGLVAIATLFIGFTRLFLDLGISVGIMHRQDTTPQVYSSLFWLNITTGSILTSILCVISPLVAKIYGEPSLTKILIILSMTVLFSSIGAQHRTVQQKEMRFRYISIVEILTSILTFCIAVYTAVEGLGVYSLVLSTLFNAVFSNLLFLGIGLYKDRNITFHFKVKETLPFLKIGVYSIGSHVLDYFSREIDTIIISASFGMETLGLYNLCKRIVQMIYNIVNQVLVKVVTPILAKLQHDLNVLRDTYYHLIESVALFNYPVFFSVSIFSTGILNTLYGSQYNDGSLLLTLLALYLGYISTGGPTGSLQVALGRTDVGFYWTICRIGLNSLAVWLGSLISVEAVVASLLLFNILIAPISWRILVKNLVGGRFLEYILLTLKPFLYTGLIAIPFYILFNTGTSFLWMILGGGLFFVLYCGMVYKLFGNTYFVKSFMPQVLRLKK
jgi:teichuronic acid exporter